MTEFRMTYEIAGKKKEAVWTPDPNRQDTYAFARWVLAKESIDYSPTHHIGPVLTKHRVRLLQGPDLWQSRG